LAKLLATNSLAQSLGETAAIVYSILRATAQSQQRELQLVLAQDEIIRPTSHFQASQIR
jgi:pyridoxine kinase